MYEGIFDRAQAAPNTNDAQLIIRNELADMLDRGQTVWLTPLHLLENPWRMFALMAILGEQHDGATGYHQHTGNALPWPSVELASIDERRPIKQKVIREERVPGTNHRRRNTRHTELGEFAKLPVRQASDLLRTEGYPICDEHSRGTHRGYVVEIGWLREEAQRPDCLPELKEIWLRLEKRIKELSNQPTKKSAAAQAAAGGSV